MTVPFCFAHTDVFFANGRALNNKTKLKQKRHDRALLRKLAVEPADKKALVEHMAIHRHDHFVAGAIS